MNLFVVTLGTREIQFREEFLAEAGFYREGNCLKHVTQTDISIQITPNEIYKGFLFPTFPRLAGSIMLEHLDLFRQIIEFPLIEPALQEIRDNVLSAIVYVITNQADLNLEKFRSLQNYNKDTLFYSKIIEKALFADQPEIQHIEISVTERATDIDYQYLEFSKKCQRFLKIQNQIDHIYLLPQGGIDQINHALTLQFIQAFKEKVILWQKAENALAHDLKFPFFFILDLEKQKILKHIEDFDFGLISSSIPELEKLDLKWTQQNLTEIRLLATYANYRLNLNYLQIPMTPEGFEPVTKTITRQNSCLDLYLHAKIDFRKGDYGSYLWRIFTLLENIYKIRIEPLFGDIELLYSHNDSTKWLNKLKEVDQNPKGKGLMEFLEQKSNSKGFKLNYEKPNRYAFKFIYEFLLEKGSLKEDEKIHNALTLFYNSTHSLVSKRNEIAHYLKPMSLEIIETALNQGQKKSQNKTCHDINALLDTIFGLAGKDDFGWCNAVQKKIRDLLG